MKVSGTIKNLERKTSSKPDSDWYVWRVELTDNKFFSIPSWVWEKLTTPLKIGQNIQVDIVSSTRDGKEYWDAKQITVLGEEFKQETLPSIKLSDYISLALETCEEINADVTFDIGVDTDMTINPRSLNRIKFTVERMSKDASK